MTNYDTLVNAGIIPATNSLTDSDISTINNLTPDEVNAMLALKSALGADFLQRNTINAPNCFL
jgi:hypothetical protein